MLEIYIPESEQYDEARGEFFVVNSQVLKLEHSLISVSKWEAKWHRPFFEKGQKTVSEIRDYIKCMTTNQVNPLVYGLLTPDDYKKINDYIDDPMTATTFSNDEKRSNRNESVTSELIYYWMVALEIPFECQKWHLNRLLTLIRVCNIKNQPEKKMSRREVLNQNRILNEARRKKFHTRG